MGKTAFLKAYNIDEDDFKAAAGSDHCQKKKTPEIGKDWQRSMIILKRY